MYGHIYSIISFSFIIISIFTVLLHRFYVIKRCLAFLLTNTELHIVYEKFNNVYVPSSLQLVRRRNIYTHLYTSLVRSLQSSSNHWPTSEKEEHIPKVSIRPHGFCCNAEKVSIHVHNVALSPNISELYKYCRNKVSIACRYQHEHFCRQFIQ